MRWPPGAKLPFVGSWIERATEATKTIGKLLQRKKEGISGRRGRLKHALEGLEHPIVVVVDDIDRLTSTEIRDIFRLVRLTASFPNLIYVVAFDRLRVEGALGEQNVPGREYLEKILQLSVDLPTIPGQTLSHQVSSALDQALTGLENPGSFDGDRWQDVFSEIVRPLIRNMRDVRRYAAGVRMTVSFLDGQVALVDILALEAIRVFLPDVFGRLHDSVAALTTVATSSYGRNDEAVSHKANLDSLIAAALSRADIVRALIRRIFLAGRRHTDHHGYGPGFESTWLRERRLAHRDILMLYLQRVAGTGLRAFTDAERAWRLFTDGAALNDYLRSLDPDRVEDVVGALEVFEEQFAAEHVVPATVVLLNLLPIVPVRPRQMLGMTTRFTFSRVTYRLLRKLPDSGAVEEAVREILPALTTLSARLEVIEDVGHRENAGHKMVSEDAAQVLERSWRDEVRAATAEELSRELEPMRILLIAKREADPSESPLEIPQSPALTLALLRSAQGEVLSQSMESRAVRRSTRLNWDGLIELHGSEEALGERVRSLRATRPDDDAELLALAEKYLSGWRPKE